MRPSSRRRVAAWLLALPLGSGGEECARRGRLEMISFWLLCWKLLRATAGLRRPTPELTDSSHDDNTFDNNNPENNTPTPTQAAESVTMEISSSLTDLERENLFFCQEEEGVHHPEVHGAQKEAADGEYGKGDECDYLVFEIGEERGREGGGRDERRGEIEGEDERRGEIEGEEEGRGETEGEDEERSEMVIEDGKRRDGQTEDWGKREIEGEDGGRGDTNEEGGWMGGTSSDLFISDAALYPSSEALNAPSYHSEAQLQDPWGQDLVNADDLSDGHLSDCLQAELALVYSDSDAGDDQWAALTSSDVSSQAPASRGSPDDRSDGERNRAKRGEEQEEKDVVEVKIAIKQQKDEEIRRVGDEDDEEQMRERKEAFLRSPSASSNASSSDPDRRLPVDFCVHQETSSENVSTEHVDFLLARQQWRKMEEEVKGQPTPKPGLKAQGSFQGTHTSLYPPTRSPRLKKREMPANKEPTMSSTMSPSSEDSGLDDLSYRSHLEEPESAVEREIRLTLEREEQHRRERGKIAKGLVIPRPSTLQTGRSPPRPPACRTPTLSISPSPSYSSSLPRSTYHEMTANNVIILEPESSSSASRNRLISSAISGLSDWPANQDNVPPPNVIVVETSNLIIRSASEFCLSSAPVPLEPQESTFTSNPFFKLRSISSQSLVEQEIRMVRQREEEWRRQREDMWRRRREEEWSRGRERYDTVLVSPGLSDNISYTVPEVPDRSVSSPSSPSRTRKMERSSLSCDHKFPSSLSSVPRRQNAMAQRWEASLLANQKKE